MISWSCALLQEKGMFTWKNERQKIAAWEIEMATWTLPLSQLGIMPGFCLAINWYCKGIIKFLQSLLLHRLICLASGWSLASKPVSRDCNNLMIILTVLTTILITPLAESLTLMRIANIECESFVYPIQIWQRARIVTTQVDIALR